MKFVISIDGGGIRGIIPAVILHNVEQWIKRSLHEVIDMAGGTSTGGLVACGVSFFDPDTTLGFYLKDSPQIFSKSWWKFGLTQSKYSAKHLEAFLKDKFGDRTLADSPHNKLFTVSYDLIGGAVSLLNSWDGEFSHCKIWEACRATSAAPIYFPTFPLQIGEKTYNLIDGGVYLNNPAVYAYHSARKLWPDEELVLLSLGTGENAEAFECRDTKKWGAIEWLAPLFSVIFDGQSDMTHYLLTNLSKTDPRLQYFRITGQLVNAKHNLDDISKENMKHLVEDALLFERNQKKDLQQLVSLLRRK